MTYAFDPELAPMVELFPSTDISDIRATRERSLAMLESMNIQVDTSGVTITDHQIPGRAGGPPVPVRVYTPLGRVPAGGWPAILDIHGGGFVAGSIDMQHAPATRVAQELGVVVVVVEYRLAPENPFPAGLEDCYTALLWLDKEAAELRVDRKRIGVGGQSAGGGLAAAVALFARDHGGPALCFQFLGIPELDHRLETASMRAFVDIPIWHRSNAELSWRYYLGPEHGDVSPYASPAIAHDLRGLPPAYITTMEFDPLRDEGILYALRLMEAWVSVQLHNFPGTFHESGAMVTASVSHRAQEELMTVLARRLQVETQTQ